MKTTKRFISLLILSVFVSASYLSYAATEQLPETITLKATLRDFKKDHPDFNKQEIKTVKNMVNTKLDEDGKPKFNKVNNSNITSAETFSQWYRDTKGINKTLPINLTLKRTSNGLYRYSNSNFFVMDNKGFGNQGDDHNFFFTLELHTQFTYKGGEQFSFTGDDDVWVFINNKLAVDLGGIHLAKSDSVKLDTLNLKKGESYKFDLFYAERHYKESNFAMDTSIVFEAKKTPSLKVPADKTVSATGVRTIVDIGTASTKNFTASVKITNDAPVDFPLGATTINWTATDKSGNKISKKQVITVINKKLPIMNVPANIRVPQTGTLTFVTLGTPVTSNFLGTPNITNNAPSGNMFPLGISQVIWSAIDSDGTKLTGVQLVEVYQLIAQPTATPIPGSVQVDYSIELTADKTKYQEGQIITYTVRYKNKSRIDSESVVVTAEIPENTELVDSAGGTVTGNEIKWNIGDLNAEQLGQKVYTVKVKNIAKSEIIVPNTSKIFSTVDKSINLDDDISKLSVLLYSNRFQQGTHSPYIQGYPDGYFKSYNNITRAEVAAIFARLIGVDENTNERTTMFEDVQQDHWANKYINSVLKAGLFEGGSDGNFRPNDSMTRAELTVVLVKYLKTGSPTPFEITFTDSQNHWAKNYIQEAYRTKLVSKDATGNFRPDEKIRRDEMVQMVNKMLYRGPLMSETPKFPDVQKLNWSFGDVEESSRQHNYKIDQLGNETPQ